MNTITLREFRETGVKYKKLRKRLDKRIKSGSFYQLTKKKQRSLVYRVRKLFEKLLRLKNLLKLATAGATMSLMLTAGQADAQNFNKKLPFKTDFKTSVAVKAYESDMFVQMTGTDNPFGGTNPFSGNIIANAGYTNFIDIDNDGDLDVFSIYQDYNSGIYTIKYFKNTGDNSNAILEEQFGTNNPFDGKFFQNQPYLSFTDIDNDGDFDAFIGDQGNSETLYYENLGNTSNPYFVKRTGGSNPLNGVDPQYMDRLSFADIDNDGDLDVFIGKYNNYPYLYRNTGDAQNPAFTQEDASAFFDATFGSSLESMLLKDLDGDGDLDGLLNGNRYFENQGSNTTPDFVEITGNSNPFNNINNLSSNLPDLIDLDTDSDLDLIFGRYNKIEYYKNTGTSSTAIFENTSGGIDSTYYVLPDFVDIDNDGDYDMFTGVYNAAASAFKFAYYKNTGTNTSPAFEKQDWADNPLNAVLNPSSIPTLKFVDIDNDGDEDVFVGGYGNGDLRYFENTGTADNPVFTEQTGADNPLPGISNPLDFDFVDIDNDGDLDLFLGNFGNVLDFYRNTGTVSAPVFTSEASPVTLPGTWYYLFPEFADVDNDGDYDLLAGSYYYGMGWRVSYAENKGTADTPDFKVQYGNENPLNLALYIPGVSLVDIDNDGDNDAFIGTSGGEVYFFKNKIVSVGVETVDKGDALNIYPNPGDNEIAIDLSLFDIQNVQVSIFDIAGKMVSGYSKIINGKINISKLKDGIYFIKVSDLKHSETAKLIVK
ncbi:MAG: T9SS type A sorting domain-containing protein [Bacteroidales bacterium]|nr:T9SS type A sorting domain-containing protein [Bacteroidales bacterium]